MKDNKLPDNSKFYAYKLNELCKEKTAQIEGITFFKYKAVHFKERQIILANWIRTGKNPKGILDCAVYDPNNPDKFITDQRKAYSLAELTTMNLKQLRELADQWNLNYVRKSETQLIRVLFEAFELEKKLKNK